MHQLFKNDLILTMQRPNFALTLQNFKSWVAIPYTFDSCCTPDLISSQLLHVEFFSTHYFLNVCQKPLEHPCSGRSFLPPSFFRCKNSNCEPPSPLYNVESIAEALSYLEKHHFPLKCYLYHLQTTLFYGGGGGILLFVYSINHRKFPRLLADIVYIILRLDRLKSYAWSFDNRRP